MRVEAKIPISGVYQALADLFEEDARYCGEADPLARKRSRRKSCLQFGKVLDTYIDQRIDSYATQLIAGAKTILAGGKLTE